MKIEKYPTITALENIYLHPISAYKDKNKPFIKTVNIGTGFGKTYMAFLAIARNLIEAKNNGEKLVCIFSAPLNNQLSIENIAKKHLESKNIPAIKVIANYKLEEHDNPNGIYQTLKQMNIPSTKRGHNKNILTEIVELLGGKATNSDVSGVESDYIGDSEANVFLKVKKSLTPKERFEQISKTLRIIKQKCSPNYVSNSIETRDEINEDLKKLGRKLHADVRTLVGAVLKLNKEPSYCYKDFNILVELLFPWRQIQKRGIGLLSMTTTKLLMMHHVQMKRGDFKPVDLRQIIHESEKMGIHNLEKTRFLIFIDEADAAKSFIESQLSGKLIQKSLITQCIGSLYREIGDIVYSSGNKIKDVKNFLEADSRGKSYTYIPLSASIDALKEQLELREIRSTLFNKMSEYREAEGIKLTKKEINALVQLNRDHLCIAVKRHDHAIQKLGAAGLFSSGTMGFLNGHLLEQIAFDTRYTREMVIGGGDALEKDNLGCSKPLRHWFEMLLEALSLSHQLNENKIDFKLTRAPIFNPENKNLGIETHATPLRALLRVISNSRIREVLSKRTRFERDMPLDIDYAFRSPQVVYALRRIKPTENFYAINENAYVPAMAEISYRLSSAEVFLEQLISKKAFLLDQEMEEETEDIGHGIFLISATGGYDAAHMNGFSNAYLNNSDVINFLRMTKIDHNAAEYEQKEAEKRRTTDIYALNRADMGESSMLRKLKPYLQSYNDTTFMLESAEKEDQIESFGYLLKNRYKKEELNRILTCLEHIAGSCKTALSTNQGKISQTMSKAMSDIHSSLMLTQTLRTLKLALFLLSQGDCSKNLSASVCEIKKDLLYQIGGGRNFTPVLVVLYNKDTDKELLNLTGSELNLLRKILGENIDLPELLTVNDLINQNSDCKVSIISAWESASRGLNIVSQDKKGKRDLDALFLIMSKHYTSAHAQWNNDPAKALSEEIERSQYIYEHLALQGGHQLHLKDLTLKTREIVPGAIEFLREQHRLMLAVGNQQGIGRVERSRVTQHQYLFIDSEILQEMANANQTMFASQPELKKTLSLLNLRVINYALEFIQKKAFIPEDFIEASFIQDETIEYYEQEKGEILNKFFKLQSGELDKQSATKIIEKWNAFNSIDWLINPEQFCKLLLQTGWSKEFVNSLWIDKTDNTRHYVYAPKQSSNELTRLLLTPQQISHHIEDGKTIHYYNPEEKIDYYKLPHLLAINSDLKSKVTASYGSSIARPHTAPDRNGVWGEYVTDLWFKTQIPKIEKISSNYHLAEIFELFDLYYTVKNQNNETVLLAVDAKNWSQQTDESPLSKKIITKAPQKLSKVETWALKRGINHVIGIYFNPRPISSSQADMKFLNTNNVISIAGIIRESDVDLVLSSDSPEFKDIQHGWNSDFHLYINNIAVNFIKEQIK